MSNTSLVVAGVLSVEDSVLDSSSTSSGLPSIVVETAEVAAARM